MKTGEIVQIGVIGAVLLGGGAVLLSKVTGPSPDAVIVEVNVPDLSSAAQNGKRVYDKSCASCHGENASGTKVGPPLIHDIYNPGHHADEAFRRAVNNGVQQHHWPYGNMPPRPEVSRNETAAIIDYVREVQAANGVTYKPHQM